MHMRLIVYFVFTSIFALQMRSAQQGEYIFGQYVPQHLGEEGIAEFLRHFGGIFDLGDFQLFKNAEGVQEIAAEHQRLQQRNKMRSIRQKPLFGMALGICRTLNTHIGRRVHGMNPSSWDEECIASR